MKDKNLPPENQELTIVTISKEKLLSVYSPKSCLKNAKKITTVEIAINSSTPSLAKISKEHTKDFTEGYVMAWLVYLNSVLNLNKPMTEDQIEMCAADIVNEYYFMKISDLTLLFKRIYSGAYGEYFESLTIPKMLSFFREYFNERCEVAERLSLQKHKDLVSDDTFNFSGNIKRILQKGAKYSK